MPSDFFVAERGVGKKYVASKPHRTDCLFKSFFYCKLTFPVLLIYLFNFDTRVVDSINNHGQRDQSRSGKCIPKFGSNCSLDGGYLLPTPFAVLSPNLLLELIPIIIPRFPPFLPCIDFVFFFYGLCVSHIITDIIPVFSGKNRTPRHKIILATQKPTQRYRELITTLARMLDTFTGLRRVRENIPRKVTVDAVASQRREMVRSLF